MRRSDIGLVRDLPLFREMTAGHFDALLNAALLQKFPEHTTLIREGEPPDFLHVLIEGTVELFAGWDGRETTIDIIRPETTFILAAVIRDEVYLKSARTISSAQILMVPAQAVRDVFGRDAAFARAIVNELADRYRDMVRALKNEKLRTSSERLANWILQADEKPAHNHVIELTFDKRTLASFLGMTPENLSRNLAALARHGVRSNGKTIAVEDPEALKHFARPDALIDRPEALRSPVTNRL